MLAITIKGCHLAWKAPLLQIPWKMANNKSGGIIHTFSRLLSGSYSQFRSLLTGQDQSMSGVQFPQTRQTLHPASQRRRPIRIAVEGNIGSGKTELLQYLMADSDVDGFMEPVNKWQDIDGVNGLALMYTDPSRWALSFQTYVQLTMLQTHQVPSDKSVKLMERSIYSAKYCFVENLRLSGKMPELEYTVLTKWFDWILANCDVGLDQIIYLRTQPETVHERIRKRCRKEEAAIPLEYLQQLHELHEDWLVRRSGFALPCPVLVLEADSDLEVMKQEFDLKRNKLLCSSG